MWVPMSTVSYNSEEFLRNALDTLVKEHKVQSYMYIFHYGENGDKDHFHVYVQPNKKLDFMDITEQYFLEYVPGHQKPLRCRPWRCSKEEDWILYDLHDQEYLASKDFDGSQDGKIPYDKSDMRYNEDFDWEVAYRRAKATIRTSARSLSIALDQGVPVTHLIETGAPPNLITQVMHAKKLDNTNELRMTIANLKSEFPKLDFLLHFYFNANIVFTDSGEVSGLVDSTGTVLGIDDESYKNYIIDLQKTNSYARLKTEQENCQIN